MTLHEARFRRRITQLDLSIAAGISQSKVSLIERGYVQPSRLELELLAQAVGIDPADLEFIRVPSERGTAA